MKKHVQFLLCSMILGLGYSIQNIAMEIDAIPKTPEISETSGNTETQRYTQEEQAQAEKARLSYLTDHLDELRKKNFFDAHRDLAKNNAPLHDHIQLIGHQLKDFFSTPATTDDADVEMNQPTTEREASEAATAEPNAAEATTKEKSVPTWKHVLNAIKTEFQINQTQKELGLKRKKLTEQHIEELSRSSRPTEEASPKETEFNELQKKLEQLKNERTKNLQNLKESPGVSQLVAKGIDMLGEKRVQQIKDAQEKYKNFKKTIEVVNRLSDSSAQTGAQKFKALFDKTAWTPKNTLDQAEKILQKAYPDQNWADIRKEAENIFTLLWRQGKPEGAELQPIQPTVAPTTTAESFTGSSQPQQVEPKNVELLREEAAEPQATLPKAKEPQAELFTQQVTSESRKTLDNDQSKPLRLFDNKGPLFRHEQALTPEGRQRISDAARSYSSTETPTSEEHTSEKPTSETIPSPEPANGNESDDDQYNYYQGNPDQIQPF